MPTCGLREPPRPAGTRRHDSRRAPGPYNAIDVAPIIGEATQAGPAGASRAARSLVAGDLALRQHLARGARGAAAKERGRVPQDPVAVGQQRLCTGAHLGEGRRLDELRPGAPRRPRSRAAPRARASRPRGRAPGRRSGRARTFGSARRAHASVRCHITPGSESNARRARGRPSIQSTSQSCSSAAEQVPPSAAGCPASRRRSAPVEVVALVVERDGRVERVAGDDDVGGVAARSGCRRAACGS